MKTTGKSLTLGLVIMACAPAARADDTGPEKSGSACVEVSTEVMYENLGYTHVVHLTNTCRKALSCTVTTNANAELVLVTMEPMEKNSVVTQRGSAARELTASVKCKPKK